MIFVKSIALYLNCARSRPAVIPRPIFTVITTNAPGCDQCVKENFNGFKIDPGDFKDLAEKMKQIGLNKEKIVLYGQNSRKLAEERYSDIEIIFKHLY